MGACDSKGVADVVPEVEKVPAKGVVELDRAVLEAVDRGEGEGFTVPVAREDATALAADIDGEQGEGSIHGGILRGVSPLERGERGLGVS